MKNMLENNFLSHYGLSVNVYVNVASTTETEFDLKDDSVLIYPAGNGVAKYKNPTQKEVLVIDYETFFKSLPQPFQNNKNNCDVITYTTDGKHFLLNELTDTGKKKGRKRTHATKQMLQVLQNILEVSGIEAFINNFTIKRCCYFNKKSQSPSVKVNAPNSFSRLSDVAPYGSKMGNNDIESLGFELWEFSGNQTYLLDTPSNMKSFAEQLSKLSTKDVKELTEIIPQII